MSTWIPSTPSPPSSGGRGSLLSLIPARYAKAVASTVGLAIAYLEAYGPSWHLVPAAIAIGGILGVYGVPNRTT